MYIATQRKPDHEGLVVHQLLLYQVKAKDSILRIVHQSQDNINHNGGQQPQFKHPAPGESASPEDISQATQHDAQYNAISHTASRLGVFLAYICNRYFAIGAGNIYLAHKRRYFEAMSDASPMFFFKYLTIAPLARALAWGVVELSKRFFSRLDYEARRWIEENPQVLEEIFGPILRKLCPTWLTFTLSLFVLIMEESVQVQIV